MDLPKTDQMNADELVQQFKINYEKQKTQMITSMLDLELIKWSQYIPSTDKQTTHTHDIMLNSYNLSTDDCILIAVLHKYCTSKSTTTHNMYAIRYPGSIQMKIEPKI
jgi:hypothetical protein